MKCFKYDLQNNTGEINLKKSNFLCLILTLLFISFLNYSNCINSKNFSPKNKNKESLHQSNEILNQSISLKISIKENNTFSLPHLTDKVDLEIKTLDKKLDTLSKMIENYEKLGNRSVLSNRLSNESIYQSQDKKINSTSYLRTNEQSNSSVSFRRSVFIYKLEN
jgi:hypothetical protein